MNTNPPVPRLTMITLCVGNIRASIAPGIKAGNGRRFQLPD